MTIFRIISPTYYPEIPLLFRYYLPTRTFDTYKLLQILEGYI